MADRRSFRSKHSSILNEHRRTDPCVPCSSAFQTGGIRTPLEFDALLPLGVDRFGINARSAVEIVRHYEEMGA